MRNPGWHLVLVVAGVAVALCGIHIYGQNSAPLRILQSIPITGVQGRIDHFSIDVKGQRLFVAALGNNSVEVIDLSQGKRIHSITGLKEPQGLLYASDLNQLFVANGEDGTLRVFDTKSFALITSLKLGTDADNVRFDSGTGRVLVGYGEGALGVVDPRTQKLLATIKLAGHPESFQLEKSRPRIYVNVPDANHIAVIDTKQTVAATWSTGELRSNFPMALDEPHHRLFVGFRKPARLAVFDTESGKQIAMVNCSGDTDDVFYDQENGRVYVSAGEGFIDVIKQMDADHYQPISKMPTAAGARTSFFVPELHRLFLAVPSRARQEPAIRVYEVIGEPSRK